MIKCHEIPISRVQEYAGVETLKETWGSKSGTVIANPANLRSVRSEMLFSGISFLVAFLSYIRLYLPFPFNPCVFLP